MYKAKHRKHNGLYYQDLHTQSHLTIQTLKQTQGTSRYVLDNMEGKDDIYVYGKNILLILENTFE